MLTSEVAMGIRIRKDNSCFLCFYLCLCSNFLLSSGADTISANQSLSGNRTIVSSGGNFEFGFFTPSGDSSNFYIGIWYKKVSIQTIVWVANRVSHVPNKYSSELKILDGNLVLLNEFKLPVWSTNVNSASNLKASVVAVLRDDGNLVLTHGLNSTIPIWQSFDNPTDTWLPGSKLSYNKLTRTKQRLTSWKNSEDPAPGLFSLELDPNGSQYIIKWNSSEPYWTSGAWDRNIFSLVPEMRLNYIYNFSYINNTNETYFTYSLYNPSIISRFIMGSSGQVQQLTWLETTQKWNLFWSQPRTLCEVYALCGPFGTCSLKGQPFCSCLNGFTPKSDGDWKLSDYSGGCERKTTLACANSSNANVEKDKFWMYASMKLPEHPQPFTVGTSAECESACLNNCACTAYAYNGGNCSIWKGELLNLQQLSNDDDAEGRTIYVRLDASEFSKSKTNKWIVIGAVVGSVAAVLVVVGLVWVVIKRRRKTLVGTTKAAEGSLVAFGYRDLQNATKSFSEKLGGGGFGSVFKGILPDSTVIAVKKLESISQGEKQFRTEVSTIGTIQHVNLVRLRGFCSEGNKKLLVYDYMPNGSLDSHLFYDDSKVLDWKTRYYIALGTARGLFYLHEKCRDCIIHCDIKPENILLDSEFCPKVADFGLAKLIGRDFSRVLTTMRGTRGYLAPEWISGVAITAKADVYSYGMMLFEFISGRRNSDNSRDGKVKFFPSWAVGIVNSGGDVLSILDHRLNGIVDAEEVTRMCKVACWCIQDDENCRPTMGQVVQIFEGVLDVNIPPIPRSLEVLAAGNQEDIVFFTESSSSQSSVARTHNSISSSQSKNTSATSSKS